MEQLAQAMLVVTWHNREQERIPVQFNPTELSLEKSAQVAEIAIPGLDSPLLQFVRGQNERLTLDLFFDTTENGMGTRATSVTTYTDRLYELVKIEPDRHAPPVCSFIWNHKFPGCDISPHFANQRRTEFKGIVESVRQKFTLFNPEGIPLRATLTVTLREYKSLEEQLHQLNLSSPERTHSHVVQRGETLSGIAARYYRSPLEWRRLADDNGLEDPRRLPTGVPLSIPPVR